MATTPLSAIWLLMVKILELLPCKVFAVGKVCNPAACCRQFALALLLLFSLAAENSVYGHEEPLASRPGATMVNNPNITVRFSNPTYDCVAGEYCLDVEFQADIPDQQLFGMNVRFFYEDLGLEFINFRNFTPGYGAVAPDPPVILTSPPAFGNNYFGFGEPGNGPADWVNGAIQLVDLGQPPVYLPTTDWTTIFQICFSIDESDPDSTGFCPPIVWDLEEDPANGGYLSGDDGVVITLLDIFSGGSTPADEHVEQFNWAYSGGGASPPFGAPVEINCIPIACGIELVCPADITVNCGQSTLPGFTGSPTAGDQCPGAPVITYVDSLFSNSCGYLQSIQRTWYVSDSCSNLDTCTQMITIHFHGAVCGSVRNDLDDPIPGVTVQLLMDMNGNGNADPGDTLVAEVVTDSLTGNYCFDQLLPCHYVITESLPGGHLLYEDFDINPDPDGDDSIEGPNGFIPVTLVPCETDSGNVFVNFYCPADFPFVPGDTICEGGLTSFLINDPNNGLCTYTWSFGSGAAPAGATGLGPHTVEYISTPENQVNGAEVTLTLQRLGCPDSTLQVSTVKVNVYPDATIDASTSPGCYYTNRVFKPVQDEMPGAVYSWDFGFGAVPHTATGYGPHTVYYDTIGTKQVQLVIHPNAPGIDCPDSSVISFLITNCPASIGGNVKSIDGTPISGVNLKLYADADTNGLPDNSNLIRNVFTNSSGVYSMASLEPGHYVILQVQPSTWMSIDDGDFSDDGDMVENMDSLDNLIPVSLYPGEIDVINYFTEIGAPGSISGVVFNDEDDDFFPDVTESISGVTIRLFADGNADGTADSQTPLAEQVTAGDGTFFFDEVPGGHYVITELQPSGYYSIKDIDLSNDLDLVLNGNFLNDTIPVTIMNAEEDIHNYFVETDSCSLTVMNTADHGKGSLRLALACASPGDSIFFDAALSGDTILLMTGELVLDKNLILYADLEPRVSLSSTVPGLFILTQGHEVQFHQMEITSGLSSATGAAFAVNGIAHLFNVTMRRNPALPPSEYLMKIGHSGQVFIYGDCMIYHQ